MIQCESTCEIVFKEKQFRANNRNSENASKITGFSLTIQLRVQQVGYAKFSESDMIK